MKRTLSLVILLAGIASCGYAQTAGRRDLIVTDKNDSIPAKILKVTRTQVTFESQNPAGQVVSTTAAMDTLTSVFYNYFMPAKERKAIIREEKDWAKAYAGLDLGYSYIFGGLHFPPSNMAVSAARSGIALNAEAGYFVRPRLGLGLRGFWNPFMKGDATMWFVGPEINTHLYIGPKKRNSLTFAGSIGYLNYTQNHIYEIMAYPDMTVKLHTAGFMFGAAYNLAVGRKKAIQFKYTMLVTTSASPSNDLPDVVSGITSTNKSLSSMMLSVGFVFGR
ncbi:MAG: hypothetical protein IJC16_02115 [Rikenellaceae bacterium]|nr:hypothetical protein [Rikenellaceae bacterium]